MKRETLSVNTDGFTLTNKRTTTKTGMKGAPGEILLARVEAEGFARAAHVGRRVDAPQHRRERHQMPVLVRPHAPVASHSMCHHLRLLHSLYKEGYQIPLLLGLHTPTGSQGSTSSLSDSSPSPEIITLPSAYRLTTSPHEKASAALATTFIRMSSLLASADRWFR